MTEKVSVITILHGEKEFIPLIIHNYHTFQKLNNSDNLELVIVDDGTENLKQYFSEIQNCLYLHLSEEEIMKFMDQIDEGYTQPNKSGLLYQRKAKTLPNGFKRDYGCGMSTHDYIFHMNMDCIYNKKSIERKFNFLKRVGAECVYCDSSLCYDIYGKELYKTISPIKIYESTLFHTREFWKRKGFQWSDIECEGKQFHYNNGIDRKLDNYYDTIQLLSIHNMNQYNPVKVELENITIDIPDIISEIKIEKHPFLRYIEDLFSSNIKLLGINSEFLMNVSEDNWESYNITEKWKQTKLAKLVQKIDSSFNVLLYGSKYPAWNLFNHIPFDIIFLETQKNYDQMTSIILNSKKYKYIAMRGVFIREDFLST
tara:strand:+ start:1081 stop:2190 length:1110 start_codon:yes stop_codon:yes gene_type:complete